MAVVLNPRQFLQSRDIWQCPEIFLVVTGGGRVSTDIHWVEARDPGKDQTMQRTVPRTKNYPAQDVNSLLLRNPDSGSGYQSAHRSKTVFLINCKMNALDIKRLGQERTESSMQTLHYSLSKNANKDHL